MLKQVVSRQIKIGTRNSSEYQYQCQNLRNSLDLEPGGAGHVPGLVLVRPDVHVRVEADLGDVAGLGVDHLTRVEVDAEEVGGAEDQGGVFV